MSSDEELDVERLARDGRGFQRRVVELAADDELRVDVLAWRDAIVFLDAGEIEVECAAGDRRRFSHGAVLCLAPPVNVVRNCGHDRVRLVAISRRRVTG